MNMQSLDPIVLSGDGTLKIHLKVMDNDSLMGVENNGLVRVTEELMRTTLLNQKSASKMSI